MTRCQQEIWPWRGCSLRASTVRPAQVATRLHRLIGLLVARNMPPRDGPRWLPGQGTRSLAVCSAVRLHFYNHCVQKLEETQRTAACIKQTDLRCSPGERGGGDLTMSHVCLGPCRVWKYLWKYLWRDEQKNSWRDCEIQTSDKRSQSCQFVNILAWHYTSKYCIVKL